MDNEVEEEDERQRKRKWNRNLKERAAEKCRCCRGRLVRCGLSAEEMTELQHTLFRTLNRAELIRGLTGGAARMSSASGRRCIFNPHDTIFLERPSGHHRPHATIITDGTSAAHLPSASMRSTGTFPVRGVHPQGRTESGIFVMTLFSDFALRSRLHCLKLFSCSSFCA